MAETIGFIGTGIMGQPMAANLLAKGYAVTVYNRSADKAKTLTEQGARAAATPKEVGQRAKVVILMLTGPEAINAILHGPDGLLAGMAKNGVVVNMSTVSPAYSKELAAQLNQQGLTFIDAPVSGSKKPAEEGALVILASGPQEVVTALEPVFLAMGKKVVSCGAAGNGSAMKMTVNLLLGAMMAGLSEAVAFGQQCGLDAETVLDTILAGPLGCGLYTLKAEMLRTDRFPAQFPLKHMDKDLGFVLETAAAHQAKVPLAETIHALYQQGMAMGLGDLDFAAVKKVLTSA
ncbi:MAG: NAD(P)-dependent oxidoreductase [Thermodesulfobacteriota bacterium]